MNLFLHICCGPCAIMPIMSLAEEGYQITGYFNNPNIHPLAEYFRRREGAGQCAVRLGIKLLYDDNVWDLEKWLKWQLPRAKSKSRCGFCIADRLEATGRAALTRGFKKFSTSLLYSRYQPHDFIKKRGEELAAKHGLEFVYRDFRKYWQEGIDISKAWEIYRQPYCGCVFSETERYAKKLAMVQKNKNL